MFWKQKSPQNPPEDPTLLVIGGTGRLGREVIRQALSRGYNVRAITRDLNKISSFEEGQVEWQQCDVLNKECVQKAAEGRNTIISSICPQNREPTKLFSDSFRVLAEVMKEKKIQRFLTVTYDWDNPSNSWFTQNILKRLYKSSRNDMGLFENMLEMRPKDHVQWTCVKTFNINQGQSPEKIKVEASYSQSSYTPEIYTTDLANFILNEAKERKWVRKFVTVGLEPKNTASNQ